MLTQTLNPAYAFLPTELQVAQAAIEKPEIQAMLKELAKYNLGITMPHKHNEAGEFEVLNENEMQMENDLSVSFIPRTEAAQISSIPVSWMWSANAVNPSQQCVAGCLAQTSTHRPIHSAKPTQQE
jgi:hypothetical protein